METRWKAPDEPGWRKVFTRYIVRDGHRVYPKKAKCFVFWVKDDGSKN
ncbi:MAG: hypothetical protein ACK4UN_02610 [Limisphaerales bacterium]